MLGRHDATPDWRARSGGHGLVGLLIAIVVGLGLGVLALAAPAAAATITVTNDLDPATANTTGDGVSLREAILSINQGSDFDSDVVADVTDPYGTNDTIRFTITGGGVRTITLASALPSIAEPVLIDGKSQGGVSYTGVPLIEIDGTSTTSADGLVFDASDIEVRGLIINKFDLSGIAINQPRGKVLGSYIGTDAAGTAAAQNDADGIFIAGSNSTIGGTGAGERNVISGNGAHGISICSCANATVVGNYIGINAAGESAIGNTIHGVWIHDAPGSTVGGDSAGAGNIIAGNGGLGIMVEGTLATGVTIRGNLVGTDKDGTDAIPNSGGILVISSAGVTIGGLSANARNVVSGNTNEGVAILDTTATGTTVIGNYIGTTADGAAALGNANGLHLGNAQHVIVGGTSVASRNVISGNVTAGVLVVGTSANGSVIAGNYIGTDKDGTLPLPNQMGMQVSAPGVTVGGTASGAGNVIAGNQFEGVLFHTVPSATPATTLVGNYIGTNASNMPGIGNLFGVDILDSVGVTVGGTTGTNPGVSCAGACNVISGNDIFGVQVNGTSSGTTIAGNYIGTNVAGMVAFPNGAGVVVRSGSGTTVGGTTASAGNVISGNGADGIVVGGGNPTNTTIVGNLIGTRPNGTTALPNVDNGINVTDPGGVTIGGTAAGSGNIIASNTANGVKVTGTAQASILGNSITANGALGIELGVDGFTVNDPSDADTGPNNFQNFPVVGSAATLNGNSRVSGTLNSVASQTYTVELFSSPTCDASTYGEGATFLARSTTVQTNGSGSAAFAITVPVLTLGHRVTATATDAGNRTSEFSVCQTVVTPAVTVTPSGGTTATVEGGATDTFTVVLTSEPTANVMVALASNISGLASFAPSATLTFTPSNWSTPQTVTVTSVDDQVYNASSYAIGFTVTSSDTLYNGLAVTSIAAIHSENDSVPAISIADVSGSEPNTGSGQLTFAVSMSRISGSAVSVPYATANGTALSGPDYQTASGTVTLQPGESTKTIAVTIVGDTVAESTETFTVTLSAPTGPAVLGRAQATGTILDDDTVPSCSPRPAITVTPTVSGGQLRARVSTAALSSGHANPISQLRFGTLQNAQVTVNGQAVTNGQPVTLPANTTSVEVIVSRTTPGQTTTVPFAVVDTCGEWPTIVGGGAGAGF